MTGLFSIIFILSLVSGFAYGWINHYTGFQLVIPVIVGGFFGSCLVAISFIYLYFTQKETEQEKIKRLKDEISQLKKET